MFAGPVLVLLAVLVCSVLHGEIKRSDADSCTQDGKADDPTEYLIGHVCSFRDPKGPLYVAGDDL
jgi:hypothetical protein